MRRHDVLNILFVVVASATCCCSMHTSSTRQQLNLSQPLSNSKGAWDCPRFETFLSWANHHGKHYSHERELHMRYQVFCDNSQRFLRTFDIAAQETARSQSEYDSMKATLVHNLSAIISDGRYSFYENPYADLTRDEYGHTRIMAGLGSPPPNAPIHIPTTIAKPREAFSLPASFDWRSTGVHVTPVVDQGIYGSCYAFAAIGSVEGQLNNSGHRLVPLSVETTMECDNTYFPDINAGNCGTMGGWPWLALDYLSKHVGVRTNDDFRYTGVPKGSTQTVFPCMPQGYSKVRCGEQDDMKCFKNTTQGQGSEQLCDTSKGRYYARVTGYHRYVKMNERDMMATLINVGPLAVVIDAELLQFYTGGVFDIPNFLCPQLNHAVLVVGYGSTNNGKDYWIVKNTNGPRWGEEGYFRIKRGSNACGIADEVAIGFTTTPPPLSSAVTQSTR